MMQEIKTLDSKRLRAVVTVAELQRIEAITEKRAVAESSLYGTLPLFLVCHDFENWGW